MVQNGKFVNGNKVNDNPSAYLASQSSNQGGTNNNGSSGDYYGIRNASQPQVDPQVVEKCQEDLRLLDIKADVMKEEANEAQQKLNEVK